MSTGFSPPPPLHPEVVHFHMSSHASFFQTKEDQCQCTRKPYITGRSSLCYDVTTVYGRSQHEATQMHFTFVVHTQPLTVVGDYPTTDGGRVNGTPWKLSWNILCTTQSIARFCTFGAGLYAQSVLINKISASELCRKFIKSALLVG